MKPEQIIDYFVQSADRSGIISSVSKCGPLRGLMVHAGDLEPQAAAGRYELMLGEALFEQWLKPLMESSGHPELGQYLKYGMSVSARHDVVLRKATYDTMFESYAVDSTATRCDIASPAKKHLNYEPVSFQSMAKLGSTGGRLLPDRTAHHGTPLRRRRTQVCLRTGVGHPCRDCCRHHQAP